VLLLARLARQFGALFHLPDWLDGLAVGALGDEASRRWVDVTAASASEARGKTG
jgi:hypothetical protein